MNRKDCEELGFLLAHYVYPVDEDAVSSFFKLDPRIEPCYEDAMGYVREREDVHEVFAAKMAERFGPDWPIMRAAAAARTVVWKEAEDEVYGR